MVDDPLERCFAPPSFLDNLDTFFFENLKSFITLAIGIKNPGGGLGWRLVGGVAISRNNYMNQKQLYLVFLYLPKRVASFDQSLWALISSLSTRPSLYLLDSLL